MTVLITSMWTEARDEKSVLYHSCFISYFRAYTIILFKPQVLIRGFCVSFVSSLKDQTLSDGSWGSFYLEVKSLVFLVQYL